MIKCNVTVCGIIGRDASMRTNKEGKSFLTFPLKVMVPGMGGQNMNIEVDVRKDGSQKETAGYRKGSHVEVRGTMYLKRRGEKLYFNLFANEVCNASKASWYFAARWVRTSRKKGIRKNSPTRCSRHLARRRSIMASSTSGYASSVSATSVKSGCRPV